MVAGNLDLMTREGVITLLEQATSGEDWNKGCDLVKAANGGYPSFCYKEVVQSGFMDRVTARWGSSSAISVVDLKTGKTISATGPQGRK